MFPRNVIMCTTDGIGKVFDGVTLPTHSAVSNVNYWKCVGLYHFVLFYFFNN